MTTMRFCATALASLVTATLLAACSAGGGSDSAAGGDSALQRVAPGTVLGSKSCTLTLAGLPLPANHCWQLSYRTTDTAGRAVTTLATVIVPDTAPASGRKLVSYQFAEDGLTTACAPSTVLEKGTNLEEANILLDLLAQGWVVVAADDEGPESQYGAGLMAGHAVLDGIRAALHFSDAGLETQTPVALEGYSGGALASGWAMELQGSYAPELNIVGVAEGGIPADIHAIAQGADGGAFAGIELAASIGLKRAYMHRVDFESLLNAAGQAMEENIGGMCAGSPGNAPDPIAAYALRRLDEFTTVPGLIDYPPVKAILDELKMGQRTPVTPSLFMFHTLADELIPIASVDALHESYCSRGAQVLYERSPAGEHIAGLAPFFVEALLYLQSVFAGTPFISPLATTCN